MREVTKKGDLAICQALISCNQSLHNLENDDDDIWIDLLKIDGNCLLFSGYLVVNVKI
jgi:hypothetical protein